MKLDTVQVFSISASVVRHIKSNRL